MDNTLPSERDSSGSESGSSTDTSDLGSFLKSDSADVQRQCSSKENENATLNSTTDAKGGSKFFKGLQESAMLANTRRVCTQIGVAVKNSGISSSSKLKRFGHLLRSWSQPNHSIRTKHATDPKLSQEVMVKANFKHDIAVSRSTSKRVCQEDDKHSWPNPNQSEHVGTPINQAAKSLGVSRSTSKRVCQEDDKDSWPNPNQSEHVGTPINEAADSLGVSRSTSKRVCQEDDKRSWPNPNQSKKINHATDLKLSQEMVIATFKPGKIKFRFPTSSKLLELKTKWRKNSSGLLELETKWQKDSQREN